MFERKEEEEEEEEGRSWLGRGRCVCVKGGRGRAILARPIHNELGKRGSKERRVLRTKLLSRPCQCCSSSKPRRLLWRRTTRENTISFLSFGSIGPLPSTPAPSRFTDPNTGTTSNYVPVHPTTPNPFSSTFIHPSIHPSMLCGPRWSSRVQTTPSRLSITIS